MDKGQEGCVARARGPIVPEEETRGKTISERGGNPG